MQKIENYIDGKFYPASSRNYLDNINPATGEVYSLIPDSKKEDVDQAFSAASKAYESWGKLSRLERSEYLLRLARALSENLEEFALAESIDNGKPINLSRSVDIPRSIENLEFFAWQILNFENEHFNSPDKGENTVIHKPLGVVACISPWNLPLYLFTWKIAPALAAGCTVIAKPSEVTPMSAYLFSKLAADILPPGVLNIVHGLGQHVGSALSSHSKIKALSFTGSTATGRAISIAAAPSMKRLHLEMGGKNPNIIFADCDFDKALEATVKSSFTNQGQICLCGSRIYIEESIYEKFKKAFIAKTLEQTQGNPLDEKNTQGAIVSKEHFKKILNCIKMAKKEGGKILCGGEALSLEAPFDKGYFISPTIIENLTDDCKTNQDEIFGPVVSIAPFSSIDTVIASANSTAYGLAGTIWSDDIAKARSVAAKIDSGIMWINCWLKRDLRTPFGGVKNSGRGREGGKYILNFFSDTQNICSSN